MNIELLREQEEAYQLRVREDGFEEAREAHRYLDPLTRGGVNRYLLNAVAEVTPLALDGQVLPVAVRDWNRGDSNVCSPYTHYIDYALEELARRRAESLITAAGLGLVLRLLAPLFRVCRIDKVVYLNNWLVTTNPWPSLTAAQVRGATRFLRKRFPDRVVICRSINRVFHQDLIRSLLAAGYGLIRSRRVYLATPAEYKLRPRNNSFRDRRLLKESGYLIVDGCELSDANLRQVEETYRDLHQGKYSTFNPQFTVEFFRHIANTKLFHLKAFKKHQKIDGFVVYAIQSGIMTGITMGYDTSIPQEVGLYRQIMALLMMEAEQGKLRLNLGAGSGQFKVSRGASPELEFDAVLSGHLPAYRKIPWRLLGLMMNGEWAAMLEKRLRR